MAEMNWDISAIVFEKLNQGKVKVESRGYFETVIITDVEPKALTYPEGWYYAKGCFRNKHTSTTGAYHEIKMKTSDGRYWDELARYCTLQ